jgi:transcription initiation factor IIE alpha subunit
MKSGHCLMTEKLSNESKYYRSLLFLFYNEEVLKFIRKFELETSNRKTLYSTYLFKYDSFISRFVQSLLDISKLSKSLQEKILKTKFE